MYDTIHFWSSLESQDVERCIQQLFTIGSVERHEKANGEVYYSSNLKEGARVNFSSSGLSFKGSLAKYYLGDNFQTLTRQDTQRAIERLQDELQVKIEYAKVRRADFAQNFIVSEQPEAYYPFLGGSQYFQRLSLPHSVYWKNGTREKLMYNKIEEAKAKGYKTPEIWTGENVLRYECRLTRRISSHLKWPEVTLASLSDERFYMRLFDYWLSEYEAIDKSRKPIFNYSNMNSPKDFWKQIQLIAIDQIGQDNLLQEIENLRLQKAFDKPEYYSRLKRELKELVSSPKVTAEADLIQELNTKVRHARSHYR